MVNTQRSNKKALIAKDVSPMRNMTVNKYALSSSPMNDSFGFGSRLAVPSATMASSSHRSNADLWKYNNMVNQQRDLFNNMHVC